MSKELVTAIHAAYAAGRSVVAGTGKVMEMPAMTIEGAAEAITAAYGRLQTEQGETAAFVYSRVVALALAQVSTGWGPAVVNFALAKETEQHIPAGVKLAEVMHAMAGTGLVLQGRGKGGRSLWIPAALGRDRAVKSAVKASNPVINAMAGIVARSGTGEAGPTVDVMAPLLVKAKTKANSMAGLAAVLGQVQS